MDDSVLYKLSQRRTATTGIAMGGHAVVFTLAIQAFSLRSFNIVPLTIALLAFFLAIVRVFSLPTTLFGVSSDDLPPAMTAAVLTSQFALVAATVWILLFIIPFQLILLTAVIVGCGAVQLLGLGYALTSKGLLSRLPPSIQRTLLSQSLVEWLQESKLQLGDVWKYIPLITGMSTAEWEYYLRNASPALRHRLRTRGLMFSLPTGLRKLLLPRKAWGRVDAALAESRERVLAIADAQAVVPAGGAEAVPDAAHQEVDDVIVPEHDLAALCGVQHVLEDEPAPDQHAHHHPHRHPRVRPHDPTFEILAHRYVTRLRGLLTSLDPELIRILSIISIAGLLTNLLTSRTARAYVARSLRHTGSLALLSCSLLLPALSLLQARVGAAGPLGTLGGTPANVMATLFPSVVTAVRVNPSIRRTLIALPPVTLLALLIALMRMRVGRR